MNNFNNMNLFNNMNMNNLINENNNMNQMMGNEGNINNQNMNNFMLNLIDQNIQMANQIAINNNILKMIIENPSSFNNLNNLFNENNQNLFGNNQIPFINFNINEMNKNSIQFINNVDFFPGKSNNKNNILFENTNGFKTNMIVPIDVKMSELFSAFFRKIKLMGYNVNKLEEFVFLFNGCIISLNEQRTISEYGLVERVNKIVFFEKNNIIGG